MLNSEQHYVLSLLRESFGLQESPLPVPSDVQAIGRIILRSGILLTVYPTIETLAQKAESSDRAALEALQAALRLAYFAALKQSITQEHEGERILHALGRHQLRCIPLKGWELRKLYPKNNMRQMADLDILVAPYDYAAIKNIMEQIGFLRKSESSWKHDSFLKADVHVEMHKRLTDDSGKLQQWEKDMWSRVIPQNENVYRMSPEDEYIFHFVHLYKDFIHGSLGLRRIVDTWLLNSRTGADMARVHDVLEQFGIRTFHERMVQLGKTVMESQTMNADCAFLLSHAFAFGIYGTDKSRKASRIAVKGSSVRSGKLRALIAAILLPFDQMKAQYPALVKRPLLLPWFWLKRILGFLKGNLRAHKKRLDYSAISASDYAHMKRLFEAGGVSDKSPKQL